MSIKETCSVKISDGTVYDVDIIIEAVYDIDKCVFRKELQEIIFKDPVLRRTVFAFEWENNTWRIITKFSPKVDHVVEAYQTIHDLNIDNRKVIKHDVSRWELMEL